MKHLTASSRLSRLRALDRARLAAVAVLVTATPGCKDSPTEPPVPDVAAVALTAPAQEMEIGETIQLIATVLDTAGVSLPGRFVSWASSDPTVASVSSGGLVSGLSGGSVVITATSEGVAGEVDIMVMEGECGLEGSASLGTSEGVSGSLDPWDCVLLEVAIADGYRLSLSEGIGVEITMQSTDFDSFLLLTTHDLQVVTYDDDGGGGADARLRAQLPAGEYLVWATSFSGQALGAYSLSSDTFQAVSCDQTLGTIAAGDSVTHHLASRGCQRRGSVADTWTLQADQSARLQIDLSSSEFDTVLEITNASGQSVAYNDDYGFGLDSRIVGDFEGTYTVWVMSFSGQATGTYLLSAVGAPGLALSRRQVAAREAQHLPLRVADLFTGEKGRVALKR